jgi:single-stranded-DNA-specific exonuclease
MLEKEVKTTVEKFLKVIERKEVLIISHFDTDGITSATIMAQTLKKIDKSFSLKILKNLEDKFIEKLPKDKVILFLDLASGSLQKIAEQKIEDVFILDHHEINSEIPNSINIINPHLNKNENISSSGITYLFCKEINKENKEFAKLAILGMIGDQMEKNIDKLNEGILNDGDIQRKKGIMIYPSTRPLNRTLEFCSNPYIPGVTGNTKGVLELLREIGMAPKGGKYKSLIELDKKEMEKLTTAIILRNPQAKNREIVGDIFLIKIFNKLEDAREISAMINACSRLDRSDIALQFCMELSKAKKQAEAIHAKYRQKIITGLNTISELEKIQGKKYVIINTKNKIKDTMVGTFASILSYSAMYEEGTIIITMAYYNDKIKVSARNSGNCGRNARETLAKIIQITGGEVGGHEHAAGCMILQEKEKEFIDNLKKSLDIEVIKV